MNIIIVGAGMAGVKLAELLASHLSFQVTLFSEERVVPYNRILLSQLLGDEISEQSCELFSEEWYGQKGITIIYKPVTAILRDQFCVIVESKAYYYDRLILATGSNVFYPQPLIHFRGCTDVIGFRTLKDVEVMKSFPSHKTVVVIGGGLLGLEAANALVLRGLKVHLVHRAGHLLNRQISADASSILQKQLEMRGVEFHLEDQVSDLYLIKSRLDTVLLQSGSELSASLLVVAVGVQPNVHLAKLSGLDVDRGILINNQMQTSDSSVFAIGECTQYEQECFGLVAPCYQHAQVLKTVLEGGHAQFTLEPQATRLKVTGIQLYSAGDIVGTSEKIEFRFGDYYKCLFIRDNILVGVILIGDTSDGPWFFQLILKAVRLEHVRSLLLFGERFCQEAIEYG